MQNNVFRHLFVITLCLSVHGVTEQGLLPLALIQHPTKQNVQLSWEGVDACCYYRLYGNCLYRNAVAVCDSDLVTYFCGERHSSFIICRFLAQYPTFVGLSALKMNYKF